MSASTRIEFDHVSMEFSGPRGRMKALYDVSFRIEDSDFIAIVGPSGCGKTTMLNMAAGFIKPTEGAVRLDGQPITGPHAKRGVIFQDYGVFPWLTVRENIEFGLSLKHNRVSREKRKEVSTRYMELMGLGDFQNAYPKTLSGGMRQRVALARAYAVSPEFLLMDEPFGALDAQTRADMQQLLLDVLQEERKTIMLITHSVEEALYLASRVFVVSARPAAIRQIIDVPFTYPREAALLEDHEFGRMRADLRRIVMREYAAQKEQSQHHELRHDAGRTGDRNG